MLSKKYCHNCGDPSHISVRCPKQQKWTRCPMCEAVVLEGAGTHGNCPNTTFKSKYIGTGVEVKELSPLLKLEFLPIDTVSITTSRGEMVINDKPLWLANPNVQLRRDNGIYCFESYNEQNMITITISDENGKRRLKLDVGEHL